MKYYTIYKITNLINNNIYIGLHETNDIDDYYFGSGYNLWKAIKKYGKSNFKKEILFVFNTREEMVEKEKELVNQEFVNRRDTYNINLGGFGLSTLPEETRVKTIEKIKKSFIGRDYKKIWKKRNETLTKNNPNVYKEIGIKSGITQKEKYKNGYVNPRTNFTNVNIFNEKNELQYSCPRYQLDNFLLEKNLPKRVMLKSLSEKGTPLYLWCEPQHKEFLKYKGWYLIYEGSVRIDINQYLKELESKKQEYKEIKSKNSIFNKKEIRYIKKAKKYIIYDDENNIKYKFCENRKSFLKKNNLPKVLDATCRRKEPIKIGKYKGWRMEEDKN